MKKFLISMMVALSALAIVVGDAQAKRMGGGGSVGRQSHNVTQQSAAPAAHPGAQQAKPAAPAAAPQTVPPKPASPWKGILGGALLGLGLGALLSHFGLGGAAAGLIGSLLMIALLALAAMFIYRMLRRKTNDGGMQPAYAGMSSRVPEIGSRIEPVQPAAFRTDEAAASGAAGGQQAQVPWGVPGDFDTAGFLRQAKAHFIRMQAVWDRADVNDLREFTTPELFAELRLQLQERGPSPNHTDVVSLDAVLLGLETVDGEYMASVRFSGMIREADNAPAEPFTEVWNLTKPVNGRSGWVLAGIQQVN